MLTLRTIFLLFVLSNSTIILSQPFHQQKDPLPPVFMIGEHEANYERMVADCSVPLLNVCEGSMDIAYNVWLHMINQMELFAEEQDFDLNGTKLWLTTYWNFDGSIKHLVYYPKPNSKNMDFAELTSFLSAFAENYQSPVDGDACFSHYGSANFPSFAQRHFKTQVK